MENKESNITSANHMMFGMVFFIILSLVISFVSNKLSVPVSFFESYGILMLGISITIILKGYLTKNV